MNFKKRFLNKKSFLLFGLKRKRFVEWLSDIKAEKPGLSEFYLMAKLMVKRFMMPRSSAVSKANYFHRLWVCHHCHIFDKQLKRCRNGEEGCGCYTPFKALAPVDCWLVEEKRAGGWGLADYKGIEEGWLNSTEESQVKA